MTMMMELNNFFTPSLISTVALNLLFGAVYLCKAAVITANIDGLICPGEELVYTCVSQGTTQRWYIINQDGSLYTALTYARGDDLQKEITRNIYTFILNSTAVNEFISTVLVVATKSIHNSRLECHGFTSRETITIQITGAPMPPLNIQIIVDVYHDYFSTVLFTWDAPDNSRVNYYQYAYQVVNETSSNTSNTSVIISGVPYNKNVTFSVLATNCVGESVAVMETINIVGCSKLDDSFFIINGTTLSQAPGAEISLLCSINDREEIVYLICQDSGRWKPDPGSGLCLRDPTSTTVTDSEFKLVSSNHSTPSVMETPEISHMSFIYVYILTALIIAVCLCALVGIIICCILKLTLCWNKGERNVNHEYYEVIDPIYEAVSTVVDSNHSKAQINLENNDAYKHIKMNERSSCVSVGTDNENNINVLQMKHNKSYQSAPFNFNSDPVIPEGLTTTYTLECYETQSVCDSENIQQATSGHANELTSQNDQQVKFQNVGWPIPLYTESVDMNNSVTDCASIELTFEPQLQGVCKSELGCEKRSINSKDVESRSESDDKV